ncbi:MAG: sensor histidine kinase KdpD [Pirellulales bacterium]
MNEDRPDPEQLLAEVKRSEEAGRRGRLKIFLGYAAGVGKTYAMLEAARRMKSVGRDVVLGYIEPHARPETAELTRGFESIAPIELVHRGTPEHRGTKVREFDVDAAAARHAELLLVDELAHSNAAGCRHAKRWQDIDDILTTGTDVWTTLNVQHIESLNDVVSQVTGVTVRETIPDSVFEQADEIELVDIAPEELIVRLQQGKIYASDQALRALDGFFQRSNLHALRELSLREAARRIHTDVEDSRRRRRVSEPWSTGERLMVCVGPSPTTARVIRAAKRMADALDAPWLAVSVETTRSSTSAAAVKAVLDHFRIAERLGAETITLYGEDVAAELVRFAEERNVTRLIIGKTAESHISRIFRCGLVDRLLKLSGDVDVFVIQGAAEPTGVADRPQAELRFDVRAFTAVSLIIAVCASVAAALRGLKVADAEANTAMIFLAGTAVVAYHFGRMTAVLACVAAVLTFDFFFVPPYFTFAVSDAQYLVTFFVMLIIGVGISSLTSRLRSQIQTTQQREQRTAALHALSKQLSSLYGRVFLCNAAAAKMAEITGTDVIVYLLDENGQAKPATDGNPALINHPLSRGTAQWVAEHGQAAGSGTDTLPSAPALFLPLSGSQTQLGAVAVQMSDANASLGAPDQRHLLEACCGQLALALERDQLVIEASEARIEAEAEHMRSSLLSSVSHDLRTPLSAIAGAASSLLDAQTLSSETRRELLEGIAHETARLNRLLENLLQMTKLDAGRPSLNKQWHVIDELVGVALKQTQSLLKDHQVSVDLPSDFPLLFVDGLLIEQLIVNLLENAAVHTPAGTQVTISAVASPQYWQLHVSDNGPGIPERLESKVFEKFFRAVAVPDSVRGSGLGLAICKAVAQSHDGRLSVVRCPAGGAEFILTIPITNPAPFVPHAI